MAPRMADICMLLEGTYPYVAGGVSGWAHDLIKEQKQLEFALYTLMPAHASRKLQYEIPGNVVLVQDSTLQELPKRLKPMAKPELERFFKKLEEPLYELRQNPSLALLKEVLDVFQRAPQRPGHQDLLNSSASWDFLLRMYNHYLKGSSFLDFFWSWRSLFSGFFSILLMEYPKARCYHTLCTGYAGLLAARIHLETGAPVILTEHGIYTNERRIEIATADWLEDEKSFNLTVDQVNKNKDLRDFWIDNFIIYSKLCYEASDRIITLYEGNQELQLEDGADPGKLEIIANGIDYARYSKLERDKNHPPTVCLIGRVVPIKDVKTFVRACVKLREMLPELRAWVMGPTDEDPDYYQECQEIVNYAGIQDCLSFLGKVKIDEHLAQVDVLCLTSLSEAQPLVILEVGAAGIPSVTTNVGACKELIYGRRDEDPNLGPGGAVVSLASPGEVAQACFDLLSDPQYYAQCGFSIQERVASYYSKEQQNQAYRQLYTRLIQKGGLQEEGEAAWQA